MANVRPVIVWTVVVAGGSGQRFGAPKQFADLGPERVLDRSVRIARAASAGVVAVVPADRVDDETARLPVAAVDAAGDAVLVVAGGATRAESVRCGLAVVPAEAEVICVHDAARPFASAEVYAAVIAAVADGADGAVPAVPVTDTIKVVDPHGNVVVTPDRATLVAVQTPQAFRAAALRAAHDGGAEGTDDASLVEATGGSVVTVAGDAHNRKITHLDDLAWARDQVHREHAGER